MRAAVIGTGWGQVHVAALQELGVQVVALCGTDLHRTRAVADERGIAVALDDVGLLADLDLDLITIAAPTAAHAQLVACLGPTALLCEKPAVGVETPIGDVPPHTGRVWVNYAFGFLDTAVQADELLTTSGELGTVSAVQVSSEYDLGELVGEPRTGWQWFSDVASHPWSWAVARFGMPEGHVAGKHEATGQSSHGAAHLDYVSEAGVPVTVVARPLPGLRGLRHTVLIEGTGGVLEFGGQFHLGRHWEFGPLLLNGAPVGADQSRTDHEQQPEHGPDAWHRANVASIAAVVAQVQSGIAHRTYGSDTNAPEAGSHALRDDPAHLPRLFTWEQALAMDACVQAVAR